MMNSHPLLSLLDSLMIKSFHPGWVYRQLIILRVTDIQLTDENHLGCKRYWDRYRYNHHHHPKYDTGPNSDQLHG